MQAVTWDLFGTLVEFSVDRDEPPVVRALLDEAGVEASEGEVLSTWVRESLVERGKCPFRSVRESLVVGACRMGAEHGFEVDAQAWARRLEAVWASAPLRPDAGRALERVEGAGVPWAIVTNLDAHVLEQVVERTALGALDPVAVCSQAARAYKPHPRPFRMALDRLGVEPWACVHVGDSPGEDRAGARAVGMRCRLVDPASVDLVRIAEGLVGKA